MCYSHMVEIDKCYGNIDILRNIRKSTSQYLKYWQFIAYNTNVINAGHITNICLQNWINYENKYFLCNLSLLSSQVKTEIENITSP